MSYNDLEITENLLNESRRGANVFNIPLINERDGSPGNQSRSSQRTVAQVREELMFQASEIKVNNIPEMTPDEIAAEYSNILDNRLTIWDEQPKSGDIEAQYGPRISNKRIHHDQDLFDVFGYKTKQWLHSAPVTHPRSQRNFLMDYSHLRHPMRKYLLSHSVNSMNRSIVDFAQRGGMSCFHRCLPNPGNPISELEKKCVHFCGETLADVRKILATDWLNYSENLDSLQVPTLPTGHDMGDKETGTMNSSNRYSQWNQYARQDNTSGQWINTD